MEPGIWCHRRRVVGRVLGCTEERRPQWSTVDTRTRLTHRCLRLVSLTVLTSTTRTSAIAESEPIV